MPEQPRSSSCLCAPLLAGLLALLSGCVSIENAPRNVPLPPLNGPDLRVPPPRDIVEETAVALAFSGGGLRAAAYSFGVLHGLEEAAGRPRHTLLDDLAFISAVSGGSMTAAYYGLHGKPALNSFREDGLLRDGEAELRFSLANPVNLARVLYGGLNNRDNFHNWLERDLFRGATYADLFRRGKPDIWINASNVYNRVTFPFHSRVFNVICSDLTRLPVSEAVAASMAVPMFFSPVVLQKFPEHCHEPTPPWVEEAANDPGKPLALRAVAKAVLEYRNPNTGRFIKLVDGGITDNLGLISILQSRLTLGTPYGPMTERDAVRIRRMLFVVVDAGQGPSGDWTHAVVGPSGVDMALAAIHTALDTNIRMSYDGFIPLIQNWRDDIVRWRCGLLAGDRARLAVPERGWDCADVQFHVTRLGFDNLGPERAARLAEIPTRLRLPEADIDSLIAAGKDSVRFDAVINQFRKEIGRLAPP